MGGALTLGLWFARYGSAEVGFDPGGAALLFAIGALLAMLVVWAFGEYRLHVLRRRWRGTARLLGLGLLLALAGGAHWPGIAVITLLVVPARTLGSALAAAALDFSLTERRAVSIGGGEPGAEVMAALAAAPDNDIRICGIFDDRDDSRSPPVVVGVPKLGTLDSLVAFARTAELDMLIVTLTLSAERSILQILKAVEVLPLDVRLSNFSADPAFRRRGGQRPQGGVIDAMSRPPRHGELAMKRASTSPALPRRLFCSPRS